MAFDNYEVGYCRPPKHTRFKKGKSGNPKGRRRGSFSLRTMLEKALTAKAGITEKGRQKFKKKWEIAMIQLANRAAKGDLAAIRLLFTYAPALLDSPSETDLRELAEFREREERYTNMTPEELDAKSRELKQMEEAFARYDAKQERRRRNANQG